MREYELLTLIAQGEGNSLEFKSSGVNQETLAKAIVAFANLRGGRILLGVDDDGSVSGWNKPKEWVMDTVVAEYVTPRVDVGYKELTTDGARVGVVSVPQGAVKPYAVRRHSGGAQFYIRMGNVSREASREQIMRMMDASAPGYVEKSALLDSDYRGELNFQLVENYFRDVDKAKYSGPAELEMLMRNRDLLVQPDFRDELFCSCAAYILFAHKPQRRLPQAGMRIVVFRGAEKEVDTAMDTTLDSPFLGHTSAAINLPSIPDLLERYLVPHIEKSKEVRDDMRRHHDLDYPWKAVREVVINAFAHRDWTRLEQIRIAAYSDRLEITSPGALPNGMTLEKIKSGEQVSRNPKIARILRDYKFVEDLGMGIRYTVIPLMLEENGCEPEFDATEDYFRVILPKAAKKKSGGGA